MSAAKLGFTLVSLDSRSPRAFVIRLNSGTDQAGARRVVDEVDPALVQAAFDANGGEGPLSQLRSRHLQVVVTLPDGHARVLEEHLHQQCRHGQSQQDQLPPSIQPPAQ
jgi:hypothetical protein